MSALRLLACLLLLAAGPARACTEDARHFWLLSFSLDGWGVPRQCQRAIDALVRTPVPARSRLLIRSAVTSERPTAIDIARAAGMVQQIRSALIAGGVLPARISVLEPGIEKGLPKAERNQIGWVYFGWSNE